MINLNIKSFLMAAFCCLFLAACADSSGSGDDMAGDDHAMAESEPGRDMDDMDDMDNMDNMDNMDDMDDMDESGDDEDAAGAVAAAGATAGAAAAIADDGEEMAAAAVADVHAVEGHAATMAVTAIELNVGEVKLPDYGWTLKWFGTNEINQAPGADINLRFAPGKMAGNSGCNEYTSSFEAGAEEKSLVMGEIASTSKMCPDEIMGAEQRYLGVLRSVSNYEFKKDGLYLRNAAGDWLHYTPEAPEAPEGE